VKIAIFGSGGVGGYFGGRLAAAGEEVTFLARGAHLNALQQDGLHIASPNGDLHLPRVQATDRPQAIGPVDVVLFTVKLYDVDAAAATLGPLIGPDTVVITLQNGVEAVDMVAKHVGASHVAGGAAYIVVVIDKPGHLRHTTAHSLVFGEPDGRRSDRLVAFEEAGVRAGFQAKASPRMTSDLWVKFVRLATWSGMTSVTRSPMGVIREDPALFEMMMTAIDEVIAVGEARGISFPDNLRESTREQIKNFPAASKSSMLEDLERGRRIELPWLSGAVVRLGKEAGVPTPTHQFITTVLTPFVNGTQA
jgi:2-dehydropantoate 2-reductase